MMDLLSQERRRKIIKDIIVSVSVLLVAIVPACGYRFTPVGGVVPEGTKSIAILTFVNDTNEPYVDLQVTQAVADEFLTDGRLRVVSLEDADLSLKGSVAKFELTPLSYTATSYVQQYMVTIVVNVSIEDLKAHKVIWQEKGLSTVFVSSYPVAYVNGTVDISATKIAKEAAVKNASKDIASTLRSRVLEGF